MRNFLQLILLIFLFSGFDFLPVKEAGSGSTESIYDIKINTLDGEAIDLHDFIGRKMLIVNVASECGYTPQYEDLQTLYENYQDKLIVIGVPCNQFGEQEPGNAQEIMEFCQKNYGVTFILTEKADVKGENQHPLYAWLTMKDKNGVANSKVKWNFQKYLISENGELLESFNSATDPLSSDITELIQ